MKTEEEFKAVNEAIKSIQTTRTPLAKQRQKDEALTGAVQRNMDDLLAHLLQVELSDARYKDSCAFRTAVELGKLAFMETLAPYSNPGADGNFALHWPILNGNFEMYEFVLGLQGIDLYYSRGLVLNYLSQIQDADQGRRFLQALLDTGRFHPTYQKLGRLYKSRKVPPWMTTMLRGYQRAR
jgi:hypothetical protein